MKRMCLIAIFGALVMGCGSDEVARPFVAQPVKKEVKAKKAKEPKKKVEPAVGAKVETKVEKGAARKEKAFAGKVTFANLSEKELANFRVIPEKGGALIKPGNRSYEQVDGFWWSKGKKGEWFKIPDHSEAWIGQSPEKYDGMAHRDGLMVYYRSGVVLKVVGALKSRDGRPEWVRDEGRTRSPVPSPWVMGQRTDG